MINDQWPMTNDQRPTPNAMKARAILFSEGETVSVVDVDIPEPEGDELLIEAAYTCVSPGTEIRCLTGGQEGSDRRPFIPGYALAGRVVARGPEALVPIGTRVLCAGTSRASAHRLWGGHVSHAVRSETQVFPLPDEVDLLDAAVSRLAAIAYHGLRLSRPMPHERVAVVGLGVIGQLAARLHALTGATVVAADREPARVEAAVRAGFRALVPAGDLEDAFRPHFPGGANVVVDATGVPAVMAQAVRLAKTHAPDDAVREPTRFLVQGSYPADFAVPYQAAFQRELHILLPRDQQPRDTHAVLDLIRRGKLAVRDLVSQVAAPEDAPAIYAALQRPTSGLLTAAFRWSSSLVEG